MLCFAGLRCLSTYLLILLLSSFNVQIANQQQLYYSLFTLGQQQLRPSQCASAAAAARGSNGSTKSSTSSKTGALST